MKKYYVIAGIALLCLSFTGTESEKVSNGRIVFASDMDGNFELYSIQNNGSDLQRLTSDLGIDAHPCYSPDGKNIAFTGQRNGKFDIYLITAEGGEPIQITKHNGTNMVPCFSTAFRSMVPIASNLPIRKLQYKTLDLNMLGTALELRLPATERVKRIPPTTYIF
jgi:hypothetical protein